MKLLGKHEAIEAIKTRLGYNVKRLDNLLALYDELSAREAGKYSSDLLRSAVVLLHATLEDVLRGLLKWKKLRSSATELAKIQFHLDQNGKGADKVTLCQLADFDENAPGDVTIRDFINASVKAHYNKESFNNRAQIADALLTLGLTPKTYEKVLGVIHPMTQRRHQIVHQSDRVEAAGGKHGETKKITKEDVVPWLNAVKQFLGDVLAALEPKPKKAKPSTGKLRIVPKK